MTRIAGRVLLVATLFCAVILAGEISITGSLIPDDPNDVFTYPFTLSSDTGLVVQSWGYGGGMNAAGTTIPGGGFDGYLSLFVGTGLTATFLASNDDGGCPPGTPAPSCRDPRLALSVPAGDYVLAVSTFGNMSFAENYGAGTLGDGFVGLGSYFDWENLSDRTPEFAVDISITSSDTLLIPEPSPLVLVVTSLAGLAGMRFILSRLTR